MWRPEQTGEGSGGGGVRERGERRGGGGPNVPVWLHMVAGVLAAPEPGLKIELASPLRELKPGAADRASLSGLRLTSSLLQKPLSFF